jgi:Fur family transcriptional regulator, peroxide stress response regulator
MANWNLTKKHQEQLRQLCNEAGIKLTHQRLEIFRELISCNDHPSAELIYKRLQQKLPTIAIDTVYRTLTTFGELGLVKKLHVMNERMLFDTNLDLHHHFICTLCKEVTDVYWPEFDDTTLPEILEKMGKVQSRHLEIHGVCNNCLDVTGKE